MIIQMRLHLLLNSRGKSQSCLLGPYPVFTKDGAIKEVPIPRKKNVMGYPLSTGPWDSPGNWSFTFKCSSLLQYSYVSNILTWLQITNADQVQDLIWMVGNLKLEVTRYSRLLYKGSDQSVDDTRDANSSGSITARPDLKRMRRPSY